MEEKRYLKWYNKVGYGSGDVAGNVVYAFLSTFVMISDQYCWIEPGYCRNIDCSIKTV